MLAALIALFSSSGLGAIIGALGGFANRWMDLKTKALDLQDKKDQRMHELNVLDKEITGHANIASIEGEAKVESAAYAALSSSYATDKASYGITFVDAIRGLMRPLITMIFVIMVVYINFKVYALIEKDGIQMDKDSMLEIIRWTLFESSVVIGWWFASRPSATKEGERKVK